MTKLQEKLAKATHHDSGEVEYGLYFEFYNGATYENDGVPAVLREEGWRATISPHRSLESALVGKFALKARLFFRNVHVVQRTVSPWEVTFD